MLRGVGVVCCTTCVRDCVCLWLLCVVALCVHVVGVCVGHVCVCLFVCVCVWLVWRDGVWVCGSGCVVMALGWWLWRGHVCVCVCVSWLWCLLVRVFLFVCVVVWWCVCCDAVWTLLAAVACVDARGLCGLTATDWRLGGGWPAWWRGHWIYSL